MCKLKEYIENRRDMKAIFDPEPNPNDDMLMLLNALKKILAACFVYIGLIFLMLVLFVRM